MKRLHAVASFGFCNAYHEVDFEFDDDTTQAEIEDEVWEWAQQFVEIGIEEIEE